MIIAIVQKPQVTRAVGIKMIIVIVQKSQVAREVGIEMIQINDDVRIGIE